MSVFLHVRPVRFCEVDFAFACLGQRIRTWRSREAGLH